MLKCADNDPLYGTTIDNKEHWIELDRLTPDAQNILTTHMTLTVESLHSIHHSHVGICAKLTLWHTGESQLYICSFLYILSIPNYNFV